MRVALLAIILATGQTVVLAHRSTCTPLEEVVYSCPLASGKAVSVCARKLPEGRYQLVYRASTRHKVELSLPEPGAEGKAVVSGNESQGARGGHVFVRFTHGQYAYVAQDLWGAPAPDATGCGSRSCGFNGVIVERAGKVVSRSACAAPGTTFSEGAIAHYGVSISERWPD